MNILKLLLPAGDEIWVRISLISLCSVLAIFLTRLLEPLIPVGFSEVIGASSVEDLLKIIANSLLAVTTFSLTVMVSVFRSASSQWSPRMHPLMMDDKTTQNTLATFIGAYVFSIGSIILLRTNLYQDTSKVVLFSFTIFVLVLIVGAIIKWVTHLRKLGSLISAARRLEDATHSALQFRMRAPFLGGHEMTSDFEVPPGCIALRADKSGYIQTINAPTVNKIAKKAGADVYLKIPIGQFVFEGEIIAYLSESSQELHDGVLANISIGDIRLVEYDPRFGFVVLSEIASRALSPGVNDPGTAIDAISRIARLLRAVPPKHKTGDAPVEHEHLWAPDIDTVDLFRDGFDAICRDGSHLIEVQVALQWALKGLIEYGDEGLTEPAKDAARDALTRAKENLTQQREFDQLKDFETA